MCCNQLSRLADVNSWNVTYNVKKAAFIFYNESTLSSLVKLLRLFPKNGEIIRNRFWKKNWSFSASDGIQRIFSSSCKSTLFYCFTYGSSSKDFFQLHDLAMFFHRKRKTIGVKFKCNEAYISYYNKHMIESYLWIKSPHQHRMRLLVQINQVKNNPFIVLVCTIFFLATFLWFNEKLKI